MDCFKVSKDDYDLCFSVPISVRVGEKNKMFVLNQNIYRNSHFRILSDAKSNFNDIIKKMNLRYIKEEPFEKAVQFHYYYYPKSKRSYDRMNILAIIDKFTCDALIEVGVLRDDNYKLVLTPLFTPCPPDKNDPRCEVYIKEIRK